MVRLSEDKSKEILSANGITVPEGSVARDATEAEQIAGDIGGPVVVKAQTNVTKRADRGLIRFADSPTEAAELAAAILESATDGGTVSEVRIEARVDVEAEWYAGVVIDSESRTPRVLFSTVGGTGVEELTDEHPDRITSEDVSISRGMLGYEAYDLVRRLDVHGEQLKAVGDLVAALVGVFKRYDARSVEINPVGLTESGEAIAMDARISIDDAAIFRHDEFEGIVAREFGRQPTELETIAYHVEEGDYRGTFYFIQTERDVEVVATGEGYIGFHGAGGGGSMMSLDAVVDAGLREPNFTDTSGNPPASKVYKAVRIILSQPGIEGYFYSGSGAASQEMYTTARGVMGAFVDEQFTVPAVLRLGGNAEADAIDIVDAYSSEVPGPIEAYGGDRSARFCANRLAKLVEANRTDPDRARAMAENRDITSADVEFDLDIDEDLGIDGLAAYRDRIRQIDAVARLEEVPHKWVF